MGVSCHARGNLKTQKGYKTELYLNNNQKKACLKHAGIARFSYNWGLNQKKVALENKSTLPSAIELHRRLNSLKQTEFPWMYEVSKCAPQEALRNLDRAFDNFYKGTWYNCKIVPINRFYPSSKTCSVCGKINDILTLSDREWICICGIRHDRDHNAAVNLEKVAASSSET